LYIGAAAAAVCRAWTGRWRRDCAVAPAGDDANTIAAPSINAAPNHAADFKLVTATRRLDKFHRFPKSTTCLRRLP
jgi:hypothetical protein